MYKVAAFYRFTPVENIPALRMEINAFGGGIDGLCGTILLAPEGVNATIGAMPGALDRMIDFLDSKLGIKQGELKYSTAAAKPFNKFKVRPKKEIITLRQPAADPNKIVGQYVDADKWNDLMNDPDVTVIDTRNTYETDVGIFKNALDPRIETFGEFPDWVQKNLDPAKHKKVAMYCTGGIRCEKASAYMLAQGFEAVYHLKGGILKYLENVPEQQSLWDGECFVFDKRVSVKHGLREGEFGLCYGCRAPLSADDMNDARFEKGVSCPACAESLTPSRASMLRARQQQFEARQ
jgi:UPF0176 protein